MAHFEKKISSVDKFSGRVIRVSLDEVELENGKTSTREVVHHNGGACIAAITDENKIYLVHQFRYAYGEELWELPAGKLEKGEDPFLAAQRELGEEVGVTAKEYCSLGQFYPTCGYCNEIIYLYAARNLSACEMHLDEDEFLTPQCFSFDEIETMILEDKIKDGKTIAAFFKLKALLSGGTAKFSTVQN
ncbi:MAG: NUDIX hydrolase [Oscillospiraceae bacterium]|nr:NUDIX hydrolase [Oscillospiraceae bacterium]